MDNYILDTNTLVMFSPHGDDPRRLRKLNEFIIKGLLDGDKRFYMTSFTFFEMMRDESPLFQNNKKEFADALDFNLFRKVEILPTAFEKELYYIILQYKEQLISYECCNGRNICEFGYVITDENFKILEKKDITINPENKFDLTGRPDGRDLYLYYPESVYYRSYKFPYFYNDIKELIEYPDQLIVGHAISNDAGFIRTACRRYKLAPINFKFADSQRMFLEFANIRKSISLENAGETLSVEKPKYLHKSDDDSELTMNLVKGMCKELDCNLSELIELCDSCSGKSENFEIKYDDFEKRQQKRYELAKSGINNMIRGRNYRMFLQFLDGVKAQGDIIESHLNGKSICLSLNYEIDNFHEMLSIVQPTF